MIKRNMMVFVFSVLLCVASLFVSCQSDLKSVFSDNGVRGSATIYDLKNNRWFYSDKRDAAVATLPASTFKIVNSLIALQEGVIKPGGLLKWDGRDKKFKGRVISAWHVDMDMASAFKKSAIWFYVELAKKIDRKKYRAYLKKINYGNMKLDHKGEDFWNYGAFAVSPKNQVDFLVKLYKGNLPFSKAHLQYVQKIMLQGKNERYTLRAKTGWGIKDGKEIGWYVGYLEKKSNCYFFATRIIANSKRMPRAFSKLRKSITMAVLKKLNFIK